MSKDNLPNSGSNSSSASSSSSSVSSASAAPSSSHPSSSSHPPTMKEFKFSSDNCKATVSYTSGEEKPDWNQLAPSADEPAVLAENKPTAASVGSFIRSDAAGHPIKTAFMHAYLQKNGQYRFFAMPTNNFNKQCQLYPFTFVLQADTKEECKVTLYKPVKNDANVSMQALVSQFFTAPPDTTLVVTNTRREPQGHVTVKKAMKEAKKKQQNITVYAFFKPKQSYMHPLKIKCPIIADGHRSIQELTEDLERMNMAEPVLVTDDSALTDNMQALALLHGESTRPTPG